jgi:hypothetical protein
MQSEMNYQNQKIDFHSLRRAKSMEESTKNKSQYFHKTRLLLSIYRTVVWRIESAVYELQDTAQEYGSDRISKLIDFLSLELDEYDLTKDKRAIEERLMCIAETKQMIQIIDKALKNLKTHPKHGEVFHDIITCCYIDKDVTSDDVIMRKLNLTQSTYYRYKKQATELMGVALWGYVIPPLKEYWQGFQ